MSPMKTCHTCKEPKGLDKFYKDKSKKDGYTYQCKLCRVNCVVNRRREKPEVYKQWKINNPDKVRNSNYKYYFNISLDDYNEMFKTQDGKCKICGTVKAEGNSEHLKVDHCHKTGKIRGLLCNSCNLGLGNFKDDIKTLESAIKHLKDLE